MDRLRQNALTVWPGMTIFWIGDLAHQANVSGHNPDDTPGVRAELTDADTDPEVRALDFMIGPKFTALDAAELVEALLDTPSIPRLYYVIYKRTIWSRNSGWLPKPYTGTPHDDHVHASGYRDDDENGANWTAVLELGEEMTPKQAEQLENIYKAIFNGGPSCGTVVNPANGRPASNSIVNKADMLLERKPEPAPVDEDRIRQIIREELDRTRLTG